MYNIRIAIRIDEWEWMSESKGDRNRGRERESENITHIAHRRTTKHVISATLDLSHFDTDIIFYRHWIHSQHCANYTRHTTDKHGIVRHLLYIMNPQPKNSNAHTRIHIIPLRPFATFNQSLDRFRSPLLAHSFFLSLCHTEICACVYLFIHLLMYYCGAGINSGHIQLLCKDLVSLLWIFFSFPFRSVPFRFSIYHIQLFGHLPCTTRNSEVPSSWFLAFSIIQFSSIHSFIRAFSLSFSFVVFLTPALAIPSPFIHFAVKVFFSLSRLRKLRIQKLSTSSYCSCIM